MCSNYWIEFIRKLKSWGFQTNVVQNLVNIEIIVIWFTKNDWINWCKCCTHLEKWRLIKIKCCILKGFVDEINTSKCGYFCFKNKSTIE